MHPPLLLTWGNLYAMIPHIAPASGADTHRGSGRSAISEMRTPSYSATAALAHAIPSRPNCGEGVQREGWGMQ